MNHLLPEDKQSLQITTTDITVCDSHCAGQNQTMIHGDVSISSVKGPVISS